MSSGRKESMDAFINAHPKVIEAMKIAREEYLGKTSTKTKKKIAGGDTNDLILIDDYTPSSAVLTSPSGRIDSGVVESLKAAIHPKKLSGSNLKIANSGPLSQVKFSGYVVSKKTLSDLVEALDALDIDYHRRTRENHIASILNSKEDATSESKKKVATSTTLSESSESKKKVATTTSIESSESKKNNTTGKSKKCAPETNSSDSSDSEEEIVPIAKAKTVQTAIVAPMDGVYGNNILTTEKYAHLDLVVKVVAPFGTRVIGTQNRSVPPNRSDPLLTVTPLNSDTINEIRKVSKLLPIFDRSMIPMIKDNELRKKISKMYDAK